MSIFAPLAAREVRVVVPDTIDDPRRVSGGDVYDRRLIDRLGACGWEVHEVRVAVGDARDLHTALAAVPDAGVALVDGLVAGRAPDAVEAAASRVRVVFLAHMVSASLPAVHATVIEGERRAIAASRCVIATSPWTRAEFVRRGLADASVIHVAVPGADAADAATGTTSGRTMLNVGVVAPHKGQDVLVAALGGLRDLGGWTCTIAGSLDTSADFAVAVARSTAEHGLADRVTLAGVMSAPALTAAYRAADLVVAPSRAESYGMAVTDALRRGIPVVASAVGGIPDAVAASRGAALLVPPDDVDALRTALRRWMTEPGLRERLRLRALETRTRLPVWGATAASVAAVLAGMP